MKKYKVEVDYRCTEVYFVEAESEEDAREQSRAKTRTRAIIQYKRNPRPAPFFARNRATCDVSWEVQTWGPYVEEVANELAQ